MVTRGVLFDKDGTLVDFFKMWVPAYREAAEVVVSMIERPALLDRLLRSGGYDPASGKVQSGSVLASGTNQEVIRTWREAAGGVWAEDVGARVLEIFHAHATRAPEPTTNLDGLFGRLRARGLKIGVGTMDDTQAAEATLDELGVRHLVDEVIGVDRVARPKPAPDMIELFCDAHDLVASGIAMVGDSPIDLQMGRAAGAGVVIGVLTGPSSADDLAPWADAIVPSIATLEAALRL